MLNIIISIFRCRGSWNSYTDLQGICRVQPRICESMSRWFFLRGRWEWVAFIQDRDSAILQTWWIVCVSDKTSCVQGLFTNVSRAFRDILLKFVYCRKRSSYENSKLKLCTCAQTRTKFQLEILTINVISSIVYFREIILESSRKVSETTQNLEHRRFMFGTNRSPRKCVVAVKSYLNDLNYKTLRHQGPLLLTWFDFNPSTDK